MFLSYPINSTDPCLTSEFKCDNGHCIDEQLTFDTGSDLYDNCGDGSDTNWGMYKQWFYQVSILHDISICIVWL